MRFRTTGILLIIFAILAGVVLLDANRKPNQTPQAQVTWVLTLSKDDVQELDVTDNGQSAVLVKKDDNTWAIGDATGPEADSTRVGAIVASLVDLRATRVLTDTVEGLTGYGLDNPGTTIILKLTNGQQETLSVGNRNLQGAQYYVLRNRQTPVYLVYQQVIDDSKKLVSEPAYKPTPQPVAGQTAAPGTLAPAATPKP